MQIQMHIQITNKNRTEIQTKTQIQIVIPLLPEAFAEIMGSEEKVVTAGSEMQLVSVDNHKNNNHDHDHYDYCDDYDDNENVDYESTLF